MSQSYSEGLEFCLKTDLYIREKEKRGFAVVSLPFINLEDLLAQTPAAFLT